MGRLIWTLAYLGLGYGFAVVLEGSADFLSSLSVLLLALAALAGLGFMLYRNHLRLRTLSASRILDQYEESASRCIQAYLLDMAPLGSSSDVRLP